MVGVEIDGVVVAAYAKTADAAADQLSAAASGIGAAESRPYGELGTQLGVGTSYLRAVDALRRHLTDGAEALHSAAEALRDATSRHAAHDADAAALLDRAGDPT